MSAEDMREAAAKVALLPCPFCGSDRVTVWNIRDGQEAVCKDCGSTGKAAFNGSNRDTWERAVAAWNTRALPPPPSIVRDALRQARDIFLEEIERERLFSAPPREALYRTLAEQMEAALASLPPPSGDQS